MAKQQPGKLVCGQEVRLVDGTTQRVKPRALGSGERILQPGRRRREDVLRQVHHREHLRPGLRHRTASLAPHELNLQGTDRLAYARTPSAIPYPGRRAARSCGEVRATPTMTMSARALRTSAVVAVVTWAREPRAKLVTSRGRLCASATTA